MAKISLVAVGIAIGIEESDTGFGHEKLDVYPVDIEYIGRAFRLCGVIKSYRSPNGFDPDSGADSESKPLIYPQAALRAQEIPALNSANLI